MRTLTLFVCVAGLLVASPAPASAEGDAEKGKAAFAAKCGLCHQVGAGAKPLIGPPLKGIMGQKAGAHPDFAYSPSFKALADSGLTWTDQNLDKWIADPKAMAPDSVMATPVFTPISDAGERADIIAYLKTLPK